MAAMATMIWELAARGRRATAQALATLRGHIPVVRLIPRVRELVSRAVMLPSKHTVSEERFR